MATDYDSPRKTDDDLTEDSLQELQARRMDKSSSTIDLDPDDVAESLELPGADLSNEELSFRVIPRQADEFTCSRCFLVHHRSQLAEDRDGQAICRECAASRCPRCRGRAANRQACQSWPPGGEGCPQLVASCSAPAIVLGGSTAKPPGRLFPVTPHAHPPTCCAPSRTSPACARSDPAPARPVTGMRVFP